MPGTHFGLFWATLGLNGPSDPCSGQKLSQEYYTCTQEAANATSDKPAADGTGKEESSADGRKKGQIEEHKHHHQRGEEKPSHLGWQALPETVFLNEPMLEEQSNFQKML